MTNGRKHSFFSLFGSKKQDIEAQEAAEREARQKLEKRIEQVLAEAAAPPKLLEENHSALVPVEMAEVLPITASVPPRRKVAAPVDFWQPSPETKRPYAVNQRW